jgi:CRP/FNR family transcriptional regulator, cyclic AMP receptor protein
MQSRNDKIYNFKLVIHDLICREPRLDRTIKVAQGAFIYSSGSRDAMVYSIESGQIKLVLFTPEGRKCVLAVHAAKDVFGEHCLSGELLRQESAMAMQDTHLHAIYYSDLLKLLKGESRLEELVQYLACCNAMQQEVIGSLLTENSEQRLAKVLLQLGTPPGTNNSNGQAIISGILQDDLAAMVGTTRSRVGLFLKRFRELGYIELNADHSLTIKSEMLEKFARQNAFTKIRKQTQPQKTSRDQYGLFAD